jgi:hypothetical protein
VASGEPSVVVPRAASAAAWLSGVHTACSIATTGPKFRVCRMAIRAITAPGQMINRKHRTS